MYNNHLMLALDTVLIYTAAYRRLNNGSNAERIN